MSQLPEDVVVLILEHLAWDGEERAFQRLAYLCCNSSELRARARNISRPLVIDIQIDTDTGNKQTFLLPVQDSSFLNADVHWGDGTIETHMEPELVQHVYAATGSYRVRVCALSSGSVALDMLGFSALSIAENCKRHWHYSVVKIATLGKIGIKSLEGLFAFCGRQSLDLACLNVEDITDMSYMFFHAYLFNDPIGRWNVGNVTDMSKMFDNAISFDQPIGDWNVGKVVDMSGMFFNAKSFDQPIGPWNVSKVEAMMFMFCLARRFNQPIGTWDVGNVRDMSHMFQDADEFNQPIGAWNVAKVTTMEAMFKNAGRFNQFIGTWEVGNVMNMKNMFRGARCFNQEVDAWDLSNVVKMKHMF